jgi:hypothetical protein
MVRESLPGLKLLAVKKTIFMHGFHRLAPKVIFFKEKSSQVTQKSSHDFDFFE